MVSEVVKATVSSVSTTRSKHSNAEFFVRSIKLVDIVKNIDKILGAVMLVRNVPETVTTRAKLWRDKERKKKRRKRKRALRYRLYTVYIEKIVEFILYLDNITLCIYFEQILIRLAIHYSACE